MNTVTPLLQRYLLDHLLMNRVTCIPALDLLALLPDASVDAIITDLPYGTTACAWDEIIPFAPMWAGVRRVLKPRGAFVTTSAQPFTSALVMSNPSWFQYEMIYEKTRATTYGLAQYMPMRCHENILVFCGSGTPNYFPQMQPGEKYTISTKSGSMVGGEEIKRSLKSPKTNEGRYPRSVITVSNSSAECSLHPTQKPVPLYRYLVRTYTQPGDLVLDFCCGSATTGIACREEGRRFVLGEKDAEIAATAQARLDAPFTVNMFAGVA